ncbi:serine hydrolase domain-containing protein [Mycobacterium ostraviense]|uniref:Penicillin-binding protein n=1 Tax=Mycobacterium ostraviense TaxID=2738409 RepID=A0A164CYI3_9MYCO|nr:serine hydrolase domain-containing protein [Mycobacterium ostraviense]KZS65341.1 penicillin-binding protein [Mycobacterium ostraviense]UGT93951.1 beta-lactamase family protein [Mycobacterium ostraviense]
MRALGRPPHESAAAVVETVSCTDLGVAFDELDAKINAGMKAYAIPGVAVAVWAGGQEYVKGYGVTNVDHPLPVDGDTVFRIGSTTKTFTGTAMMRLVEQGKVDLDSPVRFYIPDFAVADESVSATVTVRQLLNHTAGWDGRNGQDFGRGDDAVARYVNSMTRLPQLTPPGTAFAYNNSGLVVAGRIIELVAGTTYESAMQKLVLDPLQLAHTRYFSDQIIGLNVAAPHKVLDGKPIVDTDFWAFPRSCNPTGGLMSTARDQLRYAQFHLGDGRAPNGEQILSRQSLEAMRSNPGAGGTLFVELTGMGVTWMLRPSAENVTIVEHGGTWKGQRSGFVMVPDRNFAMTVLTNSDGGFHMINDLFACGWALHRFVGVTNLPAAPRHLGAVDLAPYEGRYIAEQVSQDGSRQQAVIDFWARDGQLAGCMGAGDANPDGQNSARLGLAFYRPDYGLDLGPDNKPTGSRSNFVRGPDGNIAWFCSHHGRLFRRQ